MATVIHRHLGATPDGRVWLLEVYADHTTHLVVTKPGASGVIPVDECDEGLYDRHGTLIASREP